MANDGITLYTHPDYDRRKDEWQLYRDLFEGDHDTLVKEKYLWKHQLESLPNDNNSKLLREIRCRRTRYFNLNEIAISLWSALFFRKNYQADAAVTKLLGAAERDIDGRGNSLLMFLKNTAIEHILNYGKLNILVDRTPGLAASKLEEQQRGKRAFFEAIHPLATMDWAIESANPARNGKYNFFRYEYDLIEPRARATAAPTVTHLSDEYYLQDGKCIVARYELKTSSNGQENRWNLIEPIPLENTEIPIAGFNDVSWMKDASQEALRFHNLRSDYDSILHHQAYQKIFAIGVNLNDENEMKALAEYVVSAISNPGASIQAIEPPDMSSLEKALGDSLDAFFKVAMNLTRQLPSNSKENQSVESYDAEKDNTYALVESTIEDVERVTNEALQHYAFFVDGTANFDGKIKLNREVAADDWSKMLQVVNAFRNEIESVEVVHKGIFKKAIQALELDETEEKAALDQLETIALGGASAERQAAASSERTALLDNVLNG